MTPFAIHDAQSAPESSRPLLESVQKSLGKIPNLFGTFAASPAVLKAYLQLSDLQEQETAFDEAERQLLFLTISAENSCGYCVAAHTTIASMKGVDEALVQAAREGSSLESPEHTALRDFAKAVVRSRGQIEDGELEAFLAAGYTRRHALEVVLAVAFKTLSNYSTHLGSVPLDEMFAKHAWNGAAAPATA